METNMKKFKDYLKEGMEAKKYTFRVKVAGDFSKDNEAKLESVLGKWKVSNFKKSGTTPVQQFPLDFPKLQNEQVNIYEVVLDYPVNQAELVETILNNIKIARENIVVRSPHEATEQYQEPKEKRTEALLTDGEYKEAPNANFEDFYGDKYNSGFVKELNDILKLQRKARGEQIPTESDASYLSDEKQNNTSPLKQAYDPRK